MFGWTEVRPSHRQHRLLVAAGPTRTHHRLIISRAKTCVGETNAEAVRLLKTQLSVAKLWTDVWCLTWAHLAGRSRSSLTASVNPESSRSLPRLYTCQCHMFMLLNYLCCAPASGQVTFQDLQGGLSLFQEPGLSLHGSLCGEFAGDQVSIAPLRSIRCIPAGSLLPLRGTNRRFTPSVALLLISLTRWSTVWGGGRVRTAAHTSPLLLDSW